jgi:hypothetical protein
MQEKIAQFKIGRSLSVLTEKYGEHLPGVSNVRFRVKNGLSSNTIKLSYLHCAAPPLQNLSVTQIPQACKRKFQLSVRPDRCYNNITSNGSDDNIDRQLNIAELFEQFDFAQLNPSYIFEKYFPELFKRMPSLTAADTMGVLVFLHIYLLEYKWRLAELVKSQELDQISSIIRAYDSDLGIEAKDFMFDIVGPIFEFDENRITFLGRCLFELLVRGDQISVVLYGNGSNGKTALLSLIKGTHTSIACCDADQPLVLDKSALICTNSLAVLEGIDHAILIRCPVKFSGEIKVDITERHIKQFKHWIESYGRSDYA